MFDMKAAMADPEYRAWYDSRPESVRKLLDEFGHLTGEIIDYEDENHLFWGWVTGFTEDDQIILSCIDVHTHYKWAISDGPHKQFLPADLIRQNPLVLTRNDQ